MVNFVKIEIRGFKSFADKVEIPFKEGVTAIIGPNGCGKSNIADAIRWTLGERSAKSLRGKSMTDVIFNGTENRKSLSYCEVALTFDNTNQRIFKGIAFDEVVISRKLDRSGSSEYFINGNRCRLADILLLLHDTGIGKEGYSIIGQGRVQEIMSAKPEDRRQIFEEAAGISKFRAERTESERKLEKTRENLKTINEVISEIEKQIKPLERQAEQAQKYFDLKDQLKYNEINHYIYQFEKDQETKVKISKRLEDFETELKENQESYDKESENYSKLLQESVLLDTALSGSNSELTELKVSAAQFEGDVNLLHEKLQNLNEQKEKASNDLSELDARLVSNAEDIKNANAEKEEKFAEYVKSSRALDDAQTRYDALVKDIDEQSSQLAKKNREIIDTMNKLTDLQNNKGTYLQQQGINLERKKTLESLVNDQKAQYNDAKTQCAISQGNIASIKEELKELSNRYAEAIEGKKDAEESVSSYKEDIQTFEKRLMQCNLNLDLYTKIKEDYAGYQDSVKLLMKDSKNNEYLNTRIWGVLAECIDVPEKYQSAIEYSLGNNMQNILVENERDAADLINYLKQRGYGRVTFRPLTSSRPSRLDPSDSRILDEPGVEGIAANLISYDRKFDGFMQTLLGATVIVNNIDNATNLYRKYDRRVKIVTLDGDVFTRGGEITGGSKRGQVSSLLSSDKNINDTKENIAKYTKRLEQAQASLNQVNEDIAAFNATINEVTPLIAEKRELLSAEVQKEKQQKDILDRLESEIENNSSYVRDVETEINDLDEKLNSIEGLEKFAQEKQEEYKKIVESSSDDVDAQKNKEREDANAALRDISVKNAQLKSDLDNCDATLNRLIQAKERDESDKIELIAEINSIQAKLDEITKAAEKTDFTEEDKQKIKDLEAHIETLTNRKVALNDEIKESDGKKTDLANKKTEVIESKTRNLNMLENLENRMLAEQTHMLDEYDVTYQGCIEIKDENYDDSNAYNLIKDIRASISRLGEINPLALETLNETKARLDEQVVQRDDIQKAHDDILEIIAELTKEMEGKFLNAFDQINENFKVVFKDLFGGGKGELRLDKSETDDVLACGIDIMAQPPGKKLQSLQLLSGGEQSLTAIAILFAILKLSPMPFCLLDEVEAALDEGNVYNFANYLKNFSDFTQFVVITHRKPTMTLADSIFGLTMQEKGVTKVVSIELEDAVNNLAKEE